MKSKEESRGKALAFLEKYKYVLLVALVGAVLLLWTGGKGGNKAAGTAEQTTRNEFDLSAMERKLSTALSQVEGAGEVSVMLTVRSSSRQVLAQDDKTTLKENSSERAAETVVVSGGAGIQTPVLLEQIYPEFQGALVVCTGGQDAGVRLKLVEAVSALTGLGADKISICRGK